MFHGNERIVKHKIGLLNLADTLSRSLSLVEVIRVTKLSMGWLADEWRFWLPGKVFRQRVKGKKSGYHAIEKNLNHHNRTHKRAFRVSL